MAAEVVTDGKKTKEHKTRVVFGCVGSMLLWLDTDQKLMFSVELSPIFARMKSKENCWPEWTSLECQVFSVKNFLSLTDSDNKGIRVNEIAPGSIIH